MCRIRGWGNQPHRPSSGTPPVCEPNTESGEMFSSLNNKSLRLDSQSRGQISLRRESKQYSSEFPSFKSGDQSFSLQVSLRVLVQCCCIQTLDTSQIRSLQPLFTTKSTHCQTFSPPPFTSDKDCEIHTYTMSSIMFMGLALFFQSEQLFAREGIGQNNVHNR